MTQPLRDPFMWLLGTGTGLYLLAQIGITGFVVLFLHEDRGLSKEAAGAVLAGIYVLAVAARIGSGTISDRLGSRLGAATDDRRRARAAHRLRRRRRRRAARAPHPALPRRRRAEHVVERARLRGRRGGGRCRAHRRRARLPADAARRRRRGRPSPSIAAVAAHSWRLAFFLAAAGPAVGVLVLQRLREPVSGRRPARTRGTSATLPAARRTPD